MLENRLENLQIFLVNVSTSRFIGVNLTILIYGFHDLPYGLNKAMEYISHPLVKVNTIEKRSYQTAIVKTCLKGNTLVILPTGLGKTVIAALLTAERLRRHPEGRCFILAPTKPLISQHFEAFKSILNLNEEEFILLTGEKPPSKRSIENARVVFFTPQVLENDLINGKINFEDVVLLILDEAHRAVGNYPYVFIVDLYLKQSKNPLVVGLTASPGSSREKIEEVKRNLNALFIEARTEKSFDVKPYVKPIKVEWIEVKLTPVFEKIKTNLESFIDEKVKSVHKAGFLETSKGKITFKEFLEAREKIKTKLAEYPQPPPELKKTMTDLMCIRHASHALELLETQGLSPLKEYFERVEIKASRSGSSSLKNFLLDGRIQEAFNLTAVYESKGVEHPKLDKLVEVVKKSFSEGARRLMVFTNYRETSKKILEKLNNIHEVKPVRLVGQADKPSDEGLSQKEQTEIISNFREGKYNVLVATQVAEEGIDVSSSDVVVFYDNVPSAVRFVQRRGRTGRKAPGKVVILIAKGTRDSAYYHIARRKEKRMIEVVKKIQMENMVEPKQQNLEQFIVQHSSPSLKSVTVFVDVREGNSPVVKELVRLGININLRNLPVGDYVLSENIVVERKTVLDFASSIIDRRLFIQAKNLASTYPKPVFIIEGENLYSVSGVSAKAIQGAILSLILDFGIPIILTKNPTETAAFLALTAEKEQVEKTSYPTLRGEKKPPSLTEQQEYIVSSLPNVEVTLARRLLKTFKTIEKIFTASKDELKKVPGIGEVTAERIRKVITESYQEDRNE